MYYFGEIDVLQRAWFGGDFASIVGECACPNGFVWDDDNLMCRTIVGYGIGSIIGSIVGILVSLALLFICCKVCC